MNKIERAKIMRPLTPEDNKVRVVINPKDVLRHPSRNRGRFAKPKSRI